MLTEREKHGMSELLHRMSSRDLTSLAQTVTSKLIVPETNGEAISAIILHTDRPTDLLKRRKVKKEFLFKYLNAKRVCIEATADKAAIITSVLQLWGSNTGNAMVSGSSSSLILSGSGLGTGEEDSLPEAPAPSRNTSYSSLCSLDYGPAGSQSRNLGHLPLNLDALTSGLARTRSSGGCDDKSSTHSISYPLRRSESANSFTMDDDDDDDFEDIPRTSLRIPTSSSSTIPLSCDPLRASEPLPSHPLSSSYQPTSMFSSGGQAPFSLHARLSQSLTPTPPPMLSSSFTSSAIPLAVPSSSSSSPLSGGSKPTGWSGGCGNNVPRTTAASLLLSSSAPSSFDPSSFFPDHGNTTGHPPQLHSPISPSSHGGVGQHEAANEMADHFVKWFYELLNSTFYSSKANEFGPQHFWTDASAKISLHQGPSSSSHHSSNSSSLSSTPTAISTPKEANINGVGGGSETICVQENAKQVAEALKHVVDKYRITYNPNMTRDGISGFVDAHGLALITACGTLHNTLTSVVCGTFQQQFGLIRDPNLGNNWKIKFTHANLVSKESVSQQPTLAQQHHLLQQSSPLSSYLHYQQPQPQTSFLNFNITSSDANTPFASSGESGASSSASSTSDAFPSSTSSAMAIS